MTYLLDANTLIAILNDRRSKPSRRLRQHEDADRTAGQALERGLILVTDNAREFSRVGGLQIENWHR